MSTSARNTGIAFIDTTVLTDVLLKKGSLGTNAKKALQQFSETQLPVYAIKEFKAGPLQNYIWLHNKFVNEGRFSNVLVALHAVSRGPMKNRVSTALEAIAGLSASFGKQHPAKISTMHGNAELDKIQSDEFRLTLKGIILRAWKNRRKKTSRIVEPLSCYAESDIREIRGGLLDIGEIKCSVSDCCMRTVLVKKRRDLEALRDVAKEGTTREHQNRYQVLRALCRTPNREMSEVNCRRLGDAVFAFFAPEDAIILTTNLKDHQPLAAALGKAAQRP